MFKYWCERYKYAALFITVLFIYSGYCIGRVYGFAYLPDEFGYWTYAARAAGYDWSDIASLGSYYSYGYSLVLFPIFKIFTDAVVAYRVAVGLNFVLIGVSFLLMALLGRKFLKLGNDESYIVAAVAVLYPGVLFYAKTTMVEVLLSTMYILICALFYYYVENNKRGILALLIISLVYIHFLHMRAVGILVAGVVSLVIYKVKNTSKIRNTFIFVVALVLVIAIGFLIKDRLQDLMYGDNIADIAINDYSGQVEKILRIFSKDGLFDFIEGLAGKLLYMGLATYGVAWFGIAYCLKKLLRIKEDKRNVVYIFIFLSIMFELLINTIYNIHPYRVDGVIYGRYHEFVFPILILLGIYEILNTTRQLLKTIVIIIAELMMTLLTINFIGRYGITELRGYFVSGISFLHNMSGDNPVTFIWKAYISGCILTCIAVALIVMFKSGRKIGRYLIYILVAIELVYTIRASQIYTDRYERAAYRDMTIASKIMALKTTDETRRIVFVPNEGEQFIGILQFAMRDEDIEVLDARESLMDYSDSELGRNDILILYYENFHNDEVSNLYDCSFINGHFGIYYNL
jgi:hypothetical protein